MRLVIHSEGAAEAGLRRFNGRGIFCTIGRKLSSFKKVINANEKKEYPQKLIDTVVNGRAHPIDKKSEKKEEKTAQKKGVKRKLPSTVKNRVAVKRKLPPPTTTAIPTKVRKYSANTTNQLINSGSGIVLD